ncbi:1-deoxy-D-xylulose-5-phosphate synthase [Bienertia sinuspersici]
MNKVIIEGDAQVVIHALQLKERRNGHVQLLVDDAHSLYNLFEDFSFNFCFRDCNQVAHRLAKWAACSFTEEV